MRVYVWRTGVASDLRAAYLQRLTETWVAALEATPGNRGVLVVAAIAEPWDIAVISFWDDGDEMLPPSPSLDVLGPRPSLGDQADFFIRGDLALATALLFEAG